MAVLLAASAGVSALQTPSTSPERHLANITQLTTGGENAEAYFSPDGKQIIFQSNPGPAAPTACDQMFTMNIDGSGKRQVSDSVCVHASGIRSVPAAAELRARLRVAGVRVL